MTGISGMILETADRVLRGPWTDDGGWPAAAWAAIEAAGLPLALVPEAAGGFGATLADGFGIIGVAAGHAAPLPLAETLIANRLLALAGLPLPGGALTIAAPGGAARLTPSATGWRLSGAAARVPWGGGLPIVVAIGDGTRDHVALVPAAAPVRPGRNLAGEPRDDIGFEIDLPVAAVAVAPPGADAAALIALGAAARTAAIAGALHTVLAMSISHACDRQQFGKPIGSFQAIRHMLAVAAGEAAAAGAAAALAANAIDGGGDGFAIAAAKGRASEAAGKITAIAQQVHGAMGITREHPLHRFTLRLLSWRDEFGGESDCYARVGRRLAGGRLWPEIAA